MLVRMQRGATNTSRRCRPPLRCALAEPPAVGCHSCSGFPLAGAARVALPRLYVSTFTRSAAQFQFHCTYNHAGAIALQATASNKPEERGKRRRWRHRAGVSFWLHVTTRSSKLCMHVRQCCACPATDQPKRQLTCQCGTRASAPPAPCHSAGPPLHWHPRGWQTPPFPSPCCVHPHPSRCLHEPLLPQACDAKIRWCQRRGVCKTAQLGHSCRAKRLTCTCNPGPSGWGHPRWEDKWHPDHCSAPICNSAEQSG